MKTVALRNKQRNRRLVLFCFVFLFAALAMTIADAAPAASAKLAAAPRSALARDQQTSASRDFWVKNAGANPATYRRARATLRAQGNRTAIYVEDKLFGKQLNSDLVSRLEWQLESAVPSGAFVNDQGLVAVEEGLVGPLPRGVHGDGRLTILFADLGAPSFDGLFNSFDQVTDAEAQKTQQHSNEANVIYVNGFRQSEGYTSSVIAHELEHLLTSGTTRESWLGEALAEGTMMLSGFFTDQPRVDQYLSDSGTFPLVTPSTVQYGPQLLFASFLIDTLPSARGTAIGALSELPASGRDAVEQLFQKETDVPLNFDAIFSNFVSYVFTQDQGAVSLPSTWRHNPGIKMPKVASFFTYKAGSGELTASLAPYTFVAIDLAQELSPSAIIQVQRIPPAHVDETTALSCAGNASVLWKPVSKTRLAVYAVGCDPADHAETVQFRLKILDQPSLNTPGPIKLLP
jgi:hypothetical protein